MKDESAITDEDVVDAKQETKDVTTKYKDVNVFIPDRENEIIVRHGYLALLGRDTDAEGLKSYVEYLGNGGTVLGFCHKLVSSAEYRVNNAGFTPLELATRFYRAILDRKPDEFGLEHTTAEIRKGKAALRVAAMLQSVEFTNLTA